MATRPLMPVLLLVLLGSAFAGCGPARTTVTGQVTFKNQPVKGTDKAPLEVSLVPLGPDEKDLFDKTVPAEVNQQDGTFVARGVIAGKVRVSIRQVDPNTLVDKLDNRFGEADSPIIRDITGGQPLAIDLANPGG